MNEKQTSLLAAFLAAKVEFAVVGGIAVNAHGHLRATHDLDLFIRPTEENARKAYHALAAAGAPVEGLQPNDLLDDEANFRFGPDEDHVDILASIGDMPFDQVWRNRMQADVNGMNVPFISKPISSSTNGKSDGSRTWRMPKNLNGCRQHNDGNKTFVDFAMPKR